MLVIDGLTKRYGAVVAVDDLSLTVRPGRLVGFVGPNGAGKSTTMRSIFGLVRPDAGTISWDGVPVDRERLNRFGYLPEQRGLYPKMPIAEQVTFFARLKGVQRDRARDRAEALLTALDLGDRLQDPLEKLSHGNQQRVQLAVSLANDPELLVLDEPFSGLDPVAVHNLERVLRERVEAGTGVLFSSHQLELVERVCDEIVIIVAGQVRAAGTVHEVRASAGHREVMVEIEPTAIPIATMLDGVDVVSISATSATVRVASDAEVGDVLERARRAGPVVRLDYDYPSLTDRFATMMDEWGLGQDSLDGGAEPAPAIATVDH